MTVVDDDTGEACTVVGVADMLRCPAILCVFVGSAASWSAVVMALLGCGLWRRAVEVAATAIVLCVVFAVHDGA